MKRAKTVLTFILVLLHTAVFSEEIKFRADSMSGKNGSKNEATTLTGNAWVKTETMEIKAEIITLSGDNFRYIIAEGSVDGKNTESKLDFTCGKLNYDRNTKIARIEDSVHMTDTENDVTADAQIIEYNQNTDIATMQINVSIKQKDNTCTSAYALYRKKEQMLEMSGNPKIVQGEDSFRAQEITLNLDTQEIFLDGRVSGTVSDTKKEKKAPETSEKTENPSPTDGNKITNEAVPEAKNSEKAEVSEQGLTSGSQTEATEGNTEKTNEQ